jgi:hypothetical protein
MTRTLAWVVSASVALFDSTAGAQALQPPPGYPGSPPPPGYPSGQTPPPGYPPGYGPTDTGTSNPAISTSEERKDSGLGLEWVYLNADIGGGVASMDSFSQSSLGLQKTSSGGPAFGAALGIRLLFFTIGARVRDLQLSGIGDLWELSGEAAFHTRIGRLDPYIGVRGGYNFVGSLNGSTVSVAAGDTPSSVSVHGFDVGPMVGLDYYLAKNISLGLDLELQFLFLQRPKVPLPAGVTQADVDLLPSQEQQLYNQSGSSAGFAFIPTAHLGIHF